jgi:Spy/CpxP family protein refolding chaperone
VCPYCGRECRWAERHGHGGREWLGQGARAGRAGRAEFGRERPGQRGGAIAAERILRHAKQLKLTGAQIESLERLSYDAKAQLIDRRAALEKARLELRQQMETDSDDIAAARKQMNALAARRVDIQELRLKHWVEVKKVLTDEQKKMLKENFPRMPVDLD